MLSLWGDSPDAKVEYQQGYSLNAGPPVLAPGPSMHVVAHYLISGLILEALATPAEFLYLSTVFCEEFSSAWNAGDCFNFSSNVGKSSALAFTLS